MKKATVGLACTLLVLILSGNAWAHSGLRIDLGGNVFGLTVSDGHSDVSVHSHTPYQISPYYSRDYPHRPYLGWGGYKSNHHHNHKHWNHHRSGHHHKDSNYSNHRGHKQRNGNHQNHQRHDRSKRPRLR
jgi:hypothetical protein